MGTKNKKQSEAKKTLLLRVAVDIIELNDVANARLGGSLLLCMVGMSAADNIPIGDIDIIVDTLDGLRLPSFYVERPAPDHYKPTTRTFLNTVSGTKVDFILAEHETHVCVIDGIPCGSVGATLGAKARYSRTASGKKHVEFLNHYGLDARHYYERREMFQSIFTWLVRGYRLTLGKSVGFKRIHIKEDTPCQN